MRRRSRTWREPLNCGGWTPLWLCAGEILRMSAKVARTRSVPKGLKGKAGSSPRSPKPRGTPAPAGKAIVQFSTDFGITHPRRAALRAGRREWEGGRDMARAWGGGKHRGAVHGKGVFMPSGRGYSRIRRGGICPWPGRVRAQAGRGWLPFATGGKDPLRGCPETRRRVALSPTPTPTPTPP